MFSYLQNDGLNTQNKEDLIYIILINDELFTTANVIYIGKRE